MQTAYRSDIDGLRAVAVLSVVVFHAFPDAVPGGFIGVDIFFVISGYLICSIVFSGLQRKTFSFADFYWRRIRRIFPALALVLLACLALGWAVLLPDEYRQLGKHTVAGAAFGSNIQYWREAGYFDAASDRKPLLHLWSLGIEEQFYLVWPAVLAWSFRRWRLPYVVLLLCAVSFAVNLFLVVYGRSAAFYLPLPRFWELLSGCLLAHSTVFFAESRLADWYVRCFPTLKARRVAHDVAGILGAGLIAAAILLLNPDRQFPGWWAILPVMGALLIIAAGTQSWINRTLLSRREIVFIGLISYPLYLWHWPLLAFAGIVTTPTVTLTWALVLLSIALAWATWRFLELEVRRATRSTSLAVSGALVVACLVGLFLFKSNGMPGRIPVESRALLSEITAAQGNSLTFAPGPAALRSLVFNAQSRQGRADAAILGDSHAGSLFPGLAAADSKRNWLLLGSPGCPPVVGVTVRVGELPCNRDMRLAFDYLGSPEAPPIVLLAFYGYYSETTDVSAARLLRPSHVLLDGQTSAVPKEGALLKGLHNAADWLLSHHKRVYLMIDVPELTFLPADCVQRPLSTKLPGCAMERTQVDQRQQGLRRIVTRLQGQFPELHVYDPLPVLCGEKECGPIVHGEVYYQDDSHLSLKGSTALAAQLVASLNLVPH